MKFIGERYWYSNVLHNELDSDLEQLLSYCKKPDLMKNEFFTLCSWYYELSNVKNFKKNNLTDLNWKTIYNGIYGDDSIYVRW